ncbi:MAG: heat-inducible transcriptional repressor [Chloroflexota bacterium]|nr:heat-inducible transcriptional repressor [Chloroflexota bacterium]
MLNDAINLDDRKEQVLKAVVIDYTSTAVPVGSQALAARHFARWSAATIRNELAYLMDTGHLRQPHTSSGRVPSDRGYRYFVDYLMEEEGLDAALKAQIDSAFANLPADMEAILEATALSVARAADNVGVVTAPRTSECHLKYLDLIHLDGPRVLAVVVLEGNVVRQQQLDLDEAVEQADLAALSGRVNGDLKGRTAANVRSYLADHALSAWERRAVEALADFMAAHDAQSATVIVHDGVRNLVKQPEFVDAERLLPVLEVLEESRDLARVLESLDPAGQVEVVIGDENPDMHLRQCSLVMTTYTGAGITGTLATIGPTRMRYPEVVACLRYISELAGRSIARLYE